MKALVIYDTNYGNTKKVAKIIAENLWKDTQHISVTDLKKKHLKGIEVLIVGSPVIGWNPTDKIIQFLASLKENELQGVKAASFDTRMKLFFFTDAAKKISKELIRAGTTIIAASQGFYVKKAEGPLLKGEKERVIVWAAGVKHHAKSI